MLVLFYRVELHKFTSFDPLSSFQVVFEILRSFSYKVYVEVKGATEVALEQLTMEKLQKIHGVGEHPWVQYYDPDTSEYMGIDGTQLPNLPTMSRICIVDTEIIDGQNFTPPISELFMTGNLDKSGFNDGKYLTSTQKDNGLPASSLVDQENLTCHSASSSVDKENTTVLPASILVDQENTTCLPASSSMDKENTTNLTAASSDHQPKKPVLSTSPEHQETKPVLLTSSEDPVRPTSSDTNTVKTNLTLNPDNFNIPEFNPTIEKMLQHANEDSDFILPRTIEKQVITELYKSFSKYYKADIKPKHGQVVIDKLVAKHPALKNKYADEYAENNPTKFWSSTLWVE